MSTEKISMGTALACFVTAWALSPLALTYLAATRAPNAKPAPERKP